LASLHFIKKRKIKKEKKNLQNYVIPKNIPTLPIEEYCEVSERKERAKNYAL